MMRTIILLAILVATSAFDWPGNAPAAVSLTYDDGTDSHLDIAMRHLDKHGFKGTFYINTHYGDALARVPEWRRAFKKGHEIGDHSPDHDCDMSGYTSKSIQKYVARSHRWLNRNIGRDPNRTFAYPCGNFIIGDGNKSAYKQAVATHYIAARATVYGTITGNFKSYELASTGWRNWRGIKSQIDKAIKTGGWAILRFHDINGPTKYDQSAKLHKRVVKYLAKKGVWVATVGKAFDYLTK